MNVQAEQLFRRYNEWRRKTANFQKHAQKHPMRDLALRQDRLQVFERLIAWCKTEGIDPERWLYTAFSIGYWKYCPPLKNLIPKHKHKSKTYAAYFRDRETIEYDRVVRERIEDRNIESGVRFDPNRDLSPTSEHRKRQYLAEGRADLCLANMEQTLGYHPKSLLCVRCPMQTHCMYQLQSLVTFNIIALRRGDITAEQAYGVGSFDVVNNG